MFGIGDDREHRLSIGAAVIVLVQRKRSLAFHEEAEVLRQTKLEPGAGADGERIGLFEDAVLIDLLIAHPCVDQRLEDDVAAKRRRSGESGSVEHQYGNTV